MIRRCSLFQDNEHCVIKPQIAIWSVDHIWISENLVITPGRLLLISIKSQW